MSEVRNTDEGGEPVNQSSSSFNSRLNLSSFAYTPPEESLAKTAIRRSPRNAQSTSSASRAEPTPSLSKRARSAIKDEPTDAAPSLSKKPRRHNPSSYAPPSTYAHLPFLPDVLAPNLICVFVGLNPGVQTARSGHAYAHPSNLFWRLLYSSGCTTRLLKPEDDVRLPELYSMGNTNIVERPTKNGAELSQKEMDDGVDVLEEKIRKYRPEAVALVGKGIWESVWRVRKGRPIRKEEFRYGWQDESENFGIVEGADGWQGAKHVWAGSFFASSGEGKNMERARIVG
ncbi:uracil DNA N-glycosylase Thp1 [Clarireedia jacksonii]